MHNFKELNCWQEAKDFSVIVYKITSNFPPSEIYGITSQIKRSAISIPSNIAEGAGRNTNKDFSRFIAIALGSSFELETQFIIASELNFIAEEDVEELILRLNKIQKMLVNFQKHLNK
ncbi:four helix bundle protein [Lutibacter sp.]|uniref:four helix bundle protein n=1 Tax=Lutibacter sp. TaxID=1925666 RepID=UPI0025BAA32E|nr:four helix bundle protein [Lutibacter sp.]MCF6182070.1 four helix bundle protein [Lutibacter sp.]